MKDRKNKAKELLGASLTYGLLFLACIGILVGYTFVGGAIMRLFGFTYKSYLSILFYFLITGIVRLPLDIIAMSLPKILTKLGFINHSISTIVHVFLDTLFNSIIFSVFDYFLDNVAATDMAIIVVSFVMAILNSYLASKAKE